jgi:hypothetical protein
LASIPSVVEGKRPISPLCDLVTDQLV